VLTKTPFKQRPPREQAEVVGFLALSLAVVAMAQNDLRRRPANHIRGRKAIWRLLSLNALGAMIYLSWGRVPSVRDLLHPQMDSELPHPPSGWAQHSAPKHWA
jgi:hypothetical protein